MTDIKNDIPREIANESRAWPFEEAKGVLKRLMALGKGQIATPEKGYVLFETGYGPSGLPHIGTFGEVARTTMVRRAFERLSDIPTRLFSFSDDMDGLRKVPGNVPKQDMLAQHIGKPLTSIPDPFDKFESFAHHNNARLREFLDSFGFEYEFISSTDMYKGGKFDEALLKMLKLHEEVRQAVLPILGEERAATYSPFLPISPKSGKVLEAPILETNPDAGTIVFEDEDGTKTEIPVTGGHCKAQWRADWALRWYALDVDYEMAGEDLITAGDIAGNITGIMGGRKPAGFRYKLFLDEHNQKISKSKGNGLSMEEWLTYAPHESLAYYMWQRPTSGKKLYFDVIPKAVDEYITFVNKLNEEEPKQKLDNPAWYIHDGRIPNSQYTPISFALLLNLVNAANTEDPAVLWAFIKHYKPDVSPESAPFLDRLVGYAIRYYKDFVLPTKQYRAPDERETAALKDLAARLDKMESGLESDEYMTEVFSAGKENGYDKDELRNWFQALYQILLGQDQGPRFGSFVALYGVKETVALINDALAGKFAKAA
ncbi:MAG: lysine--tRNA ligase [Alphaproteobacteria bacterium]|nr:lysine--tRNA ligase [Alphaproteobacteria bacterium]MCD8571173.1 lysine--tRNA ligase [Alphaproteobacteria bacterium]